MKAIEFKNFSDKEFTWKWDGIPYTFPANSTMFLEDFKAEHFAQHLVDRELTRKNLPTNKEPERSQMGALCFPDSQTITPLEAMQVNNKNKSKKATKEQEFAGLKDKKDGNTVEGKDRSPKKEIKDKGPFGKEVVKKKKLKSTAVKDK